MKTITAEMLVTKAKENGKELTLEQAEKMIAKRASLNDDELTNISGGDFSDYIDEAIESLGNPECPNSYDGRHQWKKTGATRPGKIFGDLWPDVEIRCQKCGKTEWADFANYDSE